MALIPHGFFPRSIFDAHSWLHPQSSLAHGNHHGNHHQAHPHNQTSLDLYDPFDELDRAVAKNFHWFHKPDFLDELPLFPRVPQKYRITVDCAGFKPTSIKTELNGKVLTVSAHEEHKIEGTDDFSVKQFKKTYKLPESAIPEKLVSFMAHNGHFVVEVPLNETEKLKVGDLFPQIVDEGNGAKHVTMRFNVPEHIDPSKISVSIKDHDVIFRAEDEVKKPDGVSRFHYYQRTTLPENTVIPGLKCTHENSQVVVRAPLNLEAKTYRQVPIEKFEPNKAIKQ
jgi:HSP20 family molecular chaperone IbpA